MANNTWAIEVAANLNSNSNSRDRKSPLAYNKAVASGSCRLSSSDAQASKHNRSRRIRYWWWLDRRPSCSNAASVAPLAQPSRNSTTTSGHLVAIQTRMTSCITQSPRQVEPRVELAKGLRFSDNKWSTSFALWNALGHMAQVVPTMATLACTLRLLSHLESSTTGDFVERVGRWSLQNASQHLCKYPARSLWSRLARECTARLVGQSRP